MARAESGVWTKEVSRLLTVALRHGRRIGGMLLDEDW